ncbi:hypothetical protein [Roseovarius sp. M141]|uniref:hypothetical protein n=1 Tax=Roseovarius sp. M141 TaxID=2583806 RepID=UPI0020CD61A3|nr:hypothetical protein [Roseovarius sp. M141]MCQ0093455.1 hypothetical protein [Roseovarius sp. M141]
MTLKSHLARLFAGVALTAGLTAGTSAIADFSMTEVQLHFGDKYKLGRNGNFPIFDNTTRRQTITLDHFSTNDVGDLFFFVDFFRDLDKLTPDTRAEGDQYGEIYYHLHGSQLGLAFPEASFVKALDFGVALNQGTDVSAGLVGPRLAFDVPGFRVLSLGLYAYDNFADPFNRSLDTTYQATIVWDVPFDIGAQKFQTKGFVDFIGSQGSNVANQVIFSPQVRWDIGHAFGGKENKIHLGVEYIHFENKFGISSVDEDAYSVFLGFKF